MELKNNNPNKSNKVVVENTATKKPLSRISSLDGLRGIMCIIVVFFHYLAILQLNRYIPGPAAVIIFFSLSGFLVSLRPIANYTSFVVKRLIRLSIPIIAITAFVLIFDILFHFIGLGEVDGSLTTMVGSIFNYNNFEDISKFLLSQIDLFFHPGTSMKTMNDTFTTYYLMPVWTMSWEYIFTFLIPLFVLIPTLINKKIKSSSTELNPELSENSFKKLSVTKIVVIFFVICLIIAIFGGIISYFPWQYMPSFVIGALLIPYLNSDKIPSWVTETGLIVLGIICIEFPAIFKVQTTASYIIAAFVFMYIALKGRLLKKFFNTKFLQWFGKISYSLYLTHCASMIVLIKLFIGIGFLDFLNINMANLGISLLLIFATAVPFGFLFYKFVETPAANLSRVVGKKIDNYMKFED